MAPGQQDAVEFSQSRGLGTSEENWTKATANGTGIQVLGIALKRNVEVKLVVRAARDVLDSHALLRSQIVETSKGKLSFRMPSEPVSPCVEVRPWPPVGAGDLSGILVLPYDGDVDRKLSQALSKVVIKELNTQFTNTEQKGRLDVFEIHVYPNPSQAQTLIILRLHSGPFDRPSAMIIGQMFLTSLNAAMDGKSPQLPAVEGKSEYLPPLEDLIPKSKGSKGFIQKGFDAIGYVMGSKKFSLLPFQPGFNPDRSGFNTDIVSYRLGKPGTAALLAACKMEGVTSASALSAAFLKACGDVKELKTKQREDFSFTGILDCRPYLDPPMADLVVGNYTAGFPLFEQVKEGVGLWDIARRISSASEKELGKSRQFTELPVLNMLFSAILKRPNLTASNSLRTALFTIFSDGPLNAQWKNVENLNLAGTHGPFSSMHGIGPCFFVSESIIEGPELCLSIVFPTPVHSRGQIETLAAASLEFLNAATKSS